MKEYLYKQATPFVSIDTTGKQFELKEDDVVTLCGDGLYEYRDHKFALTKETLRSHFDRIYNTSERDRYDRVYERAVVGVMQATITGMMGNLTLMEQMASRAVREGFNCVSKMIAADAVGFADALVEELKEKDF